MNRGIEALLRNPLGFLGVGGEGGEIVLSTRIRYARNLAGRSFPGALTAEERRSVCREVEAAAAAAGEPDAAGSMLIFDLGALASEDLEVLAERRLVDPGVLHSPENARLLMRADESRSVVVNAADHLRLQAVRGGFRPEECLRDLNELDDAFAAHLDYAFDDKLGYLTASPAEVGTGMRASVMLHLPALFLSGEVPATIQGIGKLHLAIRGAFGDGPENRGNLFILSNQCTLGESESEILERLSSVVRRLEDQEKLARAALLRKDRESVLDFVGRSYGILRHSHCLGGAEAVKCLSGVRLGVDLGLFSAVDRRRVDELLLAVGSAHLRKRADAPLSAAVAAIRRAALCREAFKNL